MEIYENGNGKQEEGNVDEQRGFATLALHAGQESSKWTSRAVVPPIVLATTYEQFEPASHAGFEYGRSGNPTRQALEEAIAALEKAKYGLVFGSGLASQTVITNLLKAGDHILAGDELYGGTNRYFRTIAAKFGLAIDYVDFLDVANVRQGLKANTRLVWFETPTNPLLKVTDIETVCKAVKAFNQDILVVVDNTFMSPYFQSPLALGADVSMNSISKYINGHSDVIMGAVATNNQEVYEQLKYLQNAIGAVSSPFDCFLVNRGLKTLALRMEQHQRNALNVARFLESHPMIRKVLYPGLESHPQHALHKKQTSGSGGMVSFYIDGTLSTAKAFLSNLRVFTLAESLGAVESLIEIPSLMTHASIPKETREQLGIDDTLVRVSVGLEDAADLVRDLDQALKKAIPYK